jgi:hypothetical protein
VVQAVLIPFLLTLANNSQVMADFSLKLPFFESPNGTPHSEIEGAVHPLTRGVVDPRKSHVPEF